MKSLAYRPSEPSDRRFIIESFLSSYRTAHTAGLIQMADWHAVMEPQICKLLEREGVTTFVAYHPGEADHIADLYGWIASETGHDQPMVHYVYVKNHYRQKGIATGLFKAASVDPRRTFYICAKTAMSSRLAHKTPCAKWDPLRARFPKKIPQESQETKWH